MSILPQLIVNSIIAGSLYALVAIGFALIYGATKFFNLAHGAVAAVGGYTVFALARMYGAHPWIAIIVGIIFAGAVGVGLNQFIYKPLLRRKASQLALLVASLGAFTAIQAIIAMLFTSQFRTLSGAKASFLYHIGSAVITRTQIYALVAGIAITAALLIVLKKTLFGKAVRAISDDAEVARIVGINTERTIACIFFIGSAIAGIAGIATGYDTGIEPTMGLQLLLKGVIAAIIGGMGSIYGALAGAFVLGFVENFGIWKISGEWKDAIAFVLLIGFLLFRPEGIVRK